MERNKQKDKIIRNNLGDTGVMDNLLEALQSGELFGTSNSSNRIRRAPRDPRSRDAAADFRRTVKQSTNINLIQAQ